MRYVGIDYGSKRVGIAFSDEGGVVALPYGILQNDGQLLKTLVALARAKDAGRFVIGESKDFSGRDNPIMADIRSFAAALKRESGLPVAFEGEILTSAAAKRGPGKERRPAARKTRAPRLRDVDAAAAAIILQSYLDRMRGCPL